MLDRLTDLWSTCLRGQVAPRKEPMTYAPMSEMIPVPVCQYCDPEVCLDDLAPVAVAILGSEMNSHREYVCLLHARMLAPTTMRTLEAIEPSAFDCTPVRYGERGSSLFIEWLPVGPVPAPADDLTLGWSSGYGVMAYDDGTPRERCDECGHYDGWHYSRCSSL